MTKNAKVVAMVQLPPPMHGAAKMNQHAIDALSAQFDLQVIEMRFARTVSEVNRFSLRKLALAVWLLMRLAWKLPQAKSLYICFAPCGSAYYRDCLYVLLAKLFRVPVILHLHGRGLPNMRKSRWQKQFQQHVFHRQTVILLGENLRQEVTGLNCTTVIIRNCLEAGSFLPQRTDPWAPHQPVRLLWLSNLFRSKGIETLIAACALLRAEGTDCHLTIAGDHGDISKSELDALLERHQMHDAASCIGPVSPNERQAALKNTDLFVFPSNYANEAQPLVVLEAMAASVPVITSTIATLPEFVRPAETGQLCPPDNPDLLAMAISTAIKAPEKTTIMRDQACQMCQQEFRHERFASELTKLVSDITGSP